MNILAHEDSSRADLLRLANLKIKSLIIHKTPTHCPLSSCPLPEDNWIICQAEDEFFLCNTEQFELLKYSPGLISWKDRNSIYLGCTQRYAELAGFQSPNDLIGKSNHDMPWGRNNFAAIFRAEDEESLAGNILYILGKYSYHNGRSQVNLTTLEKKMPIMKKDGKVVGTIDFLTELHKPSLSNVACLLISLGIKLTAELLHTIKEFLLEKTTVLSPREEECAYYLLKGCSAKEIARKLGLSFRTVETYLNSLKDKFCCKKMSALIVKMLELGYLDNIPMKLLHEKFNLKSEQAI